VLEISFDACYDKQVKTILLDGGGKHVNYLSDTVTHLIANNPEHPDVLEAIEIYEKTVVTVRFQF
jgi:hypothetical protein